MVLYLFNIGKKRQQKIDLNKDLSVILDFFKDKNTVNVYRKNINDFKINQVDCVNSDVLVTFKEQQMFVGELCLDLCYSPYSEIDVYLCEYMIVKLPCGYKGAHVYYYIVKGEK